MKSRIIVAAIGIPLLLAVIFFLPLWVFAVVVGAICALAAFELLRCAVPKLGGFSTPFARIVTICTMAEAFAVPLTALASFSSLPIIFALLVFGLMALSYKTEREISYNSALIIVFAGAFYPNLMTSLVTLGQYEHGEVYIMIPIIITFACDSGAYFAGTYLGKHKLAPNVSPSKTIEGSIGGFAAGILILLLYGFILKLCGFEVSFGILAIYGFLGSLACQLGDLAFSAIKRTYNVKDFGTIFPGHGGALDRFDSMSFVAPVIAILLSLVPSIG